ncbi:MAG: DUF305 domain-containing protein [Anaerolineae bacterium]|nr:DUF305 domain-containing protein [Anaerolineae bacterium]
MAFAAFAGVRAWQTQPPAETSAEVTFARDMMAHHEQAVEMALIIRDRSSNAELKQFALDILLTQQAQIGQMQGWLAVWGVPFTGAQPPMQGMGEHMGMATVQQLKELRTLPIDQAEIAFLNLMIRHHHGGVAMAQSALPQIRRAEVKRLAEAMATAQQNEIDYMQALLRERGVEPAPQPTMAPMHH